MVNGSGSLRYVTELGPAELSSPDELRFTFRLQCGIFNKSACIDYPLFLFIWTTWALGKAAAELDWKKTA